MTSDDFLNRFAMVTLSSPRNELLEGGYRSGTFFDKASCTVTIAMLTES
jgi:hypothetical protein